MEDPRGQATKIFWRCQSRYLRAGGWAPAGSSRVSSSGGIGQRPGDVDTQPAVHSQQAGVKGDIVGRAGRQAVAQIKALGGRAVLPRLDVPGQQHPPGAERRGRQPAEHTPAAAVRQHLLREHVLAHPGRRQQDPLGLEW